MKTKGCAEAGACWYGTERPGMVVRGSPGGVGEEGESGLMVTQTQFRSRSLHLESFERVIDYNGSVCYTKDTIIILQYLPAFPPVL